jgi:hypothetical protein
MKNLKPISILGAVLLFASAAAFLYFRHPKPQLAGAPQPPRTATAPTGSSAPSASPASNADNDEYLALKVTNFLGTLPPGGTPDAANHDRTYVVAYQVAFFRKAAAQKLPEENLSYEELASEDPGNMPPYVYFGENVVGKFDPAQPKSIAVRATIDKKEVRGYIDSAKLWLEPVLQRADSDHYMSLKDGAEVHAVADAASPKVLSLQQGEVIETLGKFDLNGQTWVKAQFNRADRPRYGFLLGTDVQALTTASVNPSALALAEIPRHIRRSNLTLSDSERQQLSQNGFYIEAVPPLPSLAVDDMADQYDQSGPQLFVTSDLFLHSFHLIFDRMLQDIEEKKFSPALTEMSSSLAAAAEQELKAAPPSPPEIRQALLNDLVYFSVAAKLFDPDFEVPEAAEPSVSPLVSAIEAGEGQLPSMTNVIDPANEDFTQYKVRGHYEKNETLQRYFRAMMWYGRHNFRLSEKTETLSAILIPSIVDSAQEQSILNSLDNLIGYVVGRQDKYTLSGYRSVNRKIFGTDSPGPAQLTQNLDGRIAAFQRSVAADLPSPQIVSVQTGAGLTQEQRLLKTAGFKFLGQRYVQDAFILNRLISPSVGSDRNPRNLPTALDVMMVLGSQPAAEMQQQAQKQAKWDNYETQIAKVTTSTDAQLAKPSTFYDHWLVALNALYQPIASKQFFALGQPWQYKNLNAGLGSWTELKHDTILYAEQSAAEMGEGDEFEIPPYGTPAPRGYVEPNPAFFKQLTDTLDQLLSRLQASQLATDEYVDKLTRFRELTSRAQSIAQKEVSGALITADDYTWIENLRYAFDRTLLLPRDIDEIPDTSYLQMALVADVATDNVAGRVLEEGVGLPQKIVVVVKDVSGGTRLTLGYVYSWFEMASSKRWSDSEWKQVMYTQSSAQAAQQGITPPAWYATFRKDSVGAGASRGN